jgi:hypothetical protein
MTFPVEIVLKGRDFAVTESLQVPSTPETVWTEPVVREMLVQILRAISRADNPDAPADRPVVLHGFSWIVEPIGGQVVLAIEIPMGAAVAGPFDVPQAQLDTLVAKVIQAGRPSSTTQTIH